MTDFINWLIGVARANPDPLSLIVGTLGAWALGVMLEAYAIPTSWSTRSQQGATAAATVLGGATLSTLIWGYLDPHNSIGMRLSIAIPVAAFSAIGYPAIARWATAKWPAIGTIWKMSQ